MSNEKITLLWWKLLSIIALLNISFWVFSYHYFSTQKTEIDTLTRQHLILSGIYTLVCAFRSFWPRIDLERYVLKDHWLSSIVLGRSAATIAEISFAIQMKLFIDELIYHSQLVYFADYTWIIIVFLTIAQLFCWLSVINLSHFGHIIEESLWGITFSFIAFTISFSIPVLTGTWLYIAWLGAISSWIYVAYMFMVDVPMYYKRWQSSGSQRSHVSFTHSFQDALKRRQYNRSWSIWKQEAIWLTGYFCGAVLLSISLSYLPR